MKNACEKNNDSNGQNTCENIHTASLRLNRFIAASGFCSRRKADALILNGRVAVNGNVQMNPAVKVSDRDEISVDGVLLSSPAPFVYVLLNKPVGIVSTMADPEGRGTVCDLLEASLREIRPVPVGRLDYFSEGLLLMTNDGELAFRLAHPRYQQPKVYEVIIRGQVEGRKLEIMRGGMSLDDGVKLLPVKVKAFSHGKDNTLLRMELRQGLNRQIRRMCESLGLTILKLKRVAHGILRLDERLKPGRYRLLESGEIKALRQSVGL